jgi:hypothetical protein
MKKLIGTLISLILFVSVGWAAVGYESITVADTAIGLSVTSGGGSVISSVVCTLETAQVRFRTDGTNPTTTEGHLLETGQQLTLADQTSVIKFKAIRTGAVSGVLKCSYY